MGNAAPRGCVTGALRRDVQVPALDQDDLSLLQSPAWGDAAWPVVLAGPGAAVHALAVGCGRRRRP